MPSGLFGQDESYCRGKVQEDGSHPKNLTVHSGEIAPSGLFGQDGSYCSGKVQEDGSHPSHLTVME